MHFESDLVFNTSSFFDPHHPPHPPAQFHVINPSLRYDSAPSSYHFTTATSTTRQDTPPPPPPVDSSQLSLHQSSRSRSCSSRPSSGSGPGAIATATASNNLTTSGGVIPTRTTRTRRTGSLGSASSPPPSAHFNARPKAIVIPRLSNNHGHINGGAGSLGQSSMSPLSPMSPISPISASAPSTSSANHPHGGWYNIPTNPDFPLSESMHSPGGYNSELYLPPVSAGLPSSFNVSPVSPPPLGSPSLGLGGGFGMNGAKTKKKNGTAALPFSKSLPSGMATTMMGSLTTQEKQALIANEKRRRRRESHNAVERRRRDNINEKITELATLIPECMLVEASGTNPGSIEDGGGALPSPLEASASLPTDASSSAKKEDSDTGSGAGGVVKTNKGIILRKSVEYIRYLQQLASVQDARNRELEAELRAYKATAGVEGRSNSSSSSTPSTSITISNSTPDVEEKSKEDYADPNSFNVYDSHGPSSNEFVSFGNLFNGLPSMPEEADNVLSEDHDVDMHTVVDGESNEKRERGRARIKCHIVPIKEELDLIPMEP